VQHLTAGSIRGYPKLSKADISQVKQHEVMYCVDGYHSFWRVNTIV